MRAGEDLDGGGSRWRVSAPGGQEQHRVTRSVEARLRWVWDGYGMEKGIRGGWGEQARRWGGDGIRGWAERSGV